MPNLFEDRRSSSDFDPARPLPEELLREIVRLAAFSPSANNLQPWRLVAVRTDAARQRLHAVANRQPRILLAPVTLIVVADSEGFGMQNPSWQELVERNGGDRAKVERMAAHTAARYGASPESRTKFAHKNSSLFAMCLMLAAKSLGVDSHPMDGFDVDGVTKEFGLRPGEQPSILIAMGYHDETLPLAPRRRRRTYEELVEEVWTRGRADRAERRAARFAYGTSKR